VKLWLGQVGGPLVVRRRSGPGELVTDTGTIRLRCEGDTLKLKREGGELAARVPEPTTLRLVPGGAPQGGELAGDWALASWGEEGMAFGAARFLWQDEPARMEAAGAELAVRPGKTAALLGSRNNGTSLHRISGQMEGWEKGSAVVMALDERGRMAGAGLVEEGGKFTLVGVGMATAQARAGGTALGAGARVVDGMRLAAPQTGVLRVQVLEHDEGRALPARVVLHGHEGTREPNLGAPHRASGAGPLLDLEEGRARLVLPAGRYRALATRGLEYTVDEEVVEVAAGEERAVELRLRRVVDTPGWAGCDLHVHARGSFDSLVSIDDRVRSLLAAGVDLAAASEHNRTGSYDLATLARQGDWLTWIPAIEVTTVDPPQGHFNVLPYSDPEAPRYRRTSLGELLALVARKSPGSLVQVNHPRMGLIGHFNALHLDPATQRGLNQLARSFELLEIYNGFDLGEPAKVEGLLGEWLRLLERGRTHWATGNSDSHSVQYVGVGYPRTYVKVREDHEGGAGAPLDVPGVLAGLKAGKIVVTSGPFVDVSQEERGPGEALQVAGGVARVRVRVRSAPWLDVQEVEAYAGGKSAGRWAIAEALGPRTGKPVGPLGEARAQAVRFEQTLDVPVEPGARALVVVARGRRKVSEVLPFLEWAPMAIVNPMLVEAR
jgi:hypothetical protein